MQAVQGAGAGQQEEEQGAGMGWERSRGEQVSKASGQAPTAEQEGVQRGAKIDRDVSCAPAGSASRQGRQGARQQVEEEGYVQARVLGRSGAMETHTDRFSGPEGVTGVDPLSSLQAIEKGVEEGGVDGRGAGGAGRPPRGRDVLDYPMPVEQQLPAAEVDAQMPEHAAGADCIPGRCCA